MGAVWGEVTEDGHQFAHYEPDLQQRVWWVVKDDREVLALIALDYVTRVTLRVHPIVLPDHRQRARRILQCALREYIRLGPYRKLVSEIPVYARHVRLFVRSLGFVQEGIRTKSYIKQGLLQDVYLYGATNDQLRVDDNG